MGTLFTICIHCVPHTITAISPTQIAFEPINVALLNDLIGLGFASLDGNHSVLWRIGPLSPRVRKKRAGSLHDNSDNVAACVMNKRTTKYFGGGPRYGSMLVSGRALLVPQKVQPAVFDDRGVQLQREEVVVEDSDRTAGVDIQENQRPLHEARSLPTGCRSLVRGGGGRRGVGGRERRLHQQSSQRCQPQGGPGEYARWGFGHLLGLESRRISARNQASKKGEEKKKNNNN